MTNALAYWASSSLTKEKCTKEKSFMTSTPGRQEDGSAEQLGRRELGRQKSSGDLGDDVAPEEAGVDESDRFRRPVELDGVEGLHLDGGDADVATDAEGDDESDGGQPRLGVTLGDVATGTLGGAIFVDFSQRRPLQFRELVRHAQLGRVDLSLDRLVDALVGILEVVLVVGAFLHSTTSNFIF